MADFVILVDENDQQIGIEEKMKAHEGDGKRHRAFSILIFNEKGETMLQQRALSKYHSGGLWTNTCCSHPRPEENTLAAAHRRLGEEMGFDCKLKEVFEYKYQIKLDHGLSENEYLHVFIGKYDEDPIINRDEAEDWKWISWENLNEDVNKNPGSYTFWFKVTLKELNKRRGENEKLLEI
ncbi:MAG: isopentenyl-diphosphate Delta-isomerase [Candidatus Shapirobacteria bacterium]|nr:isopentenyl-diphosphate Delta-isomerase [Candidatus Shapirobacteria bacterium]